MSSSEIDVTRSTKQAWKRFRSEVAERIVARGPGEHLLIEVEAPGLESRDEGCAPYVQVTWWGESLVAEVSSNKYLHKSHRLSKDARRQLRELGWGRP